jgi:hypothetical protein
MGPVVAVCTKEKFKVTEPPANADLPSPKTVKPGSGGLSRRLLLVVGVIRVIAGVVLLVSPVIVRLGPGAGAFTAVIGLIFVGVGVLLGVLVANARLADRFRAAEYRERLEAAGVGSDQRPAFLPAMDGTEAEDEASSEDA